jgi:hypothetical protein
MNEHLFAAIQTPDDVPARSHFFFPLFQKFGSSL